MHKRSSQGWLPPSLAAFVGVMAAAAPSWGYTRSVTSGGCNPLHWAQTCVYVTADSGSLPELSLADIERIEGLAVAGWRAHSGVETFLQLHYLPSSGPHEATVDGWQVIIFRSTSWCRPAESPGGEPLCYDPAALALTTVSYVSDPQDATADGRIVDADIEINAVSNYFYDADADPKPQTGALRPTDLWNTLAHELGHLQGLDHTCRMGSADPLPSCIRDDGQPLVECEVVKQGKATDPALRTLYDATMYPMATPKETDKRTPKADDLAGIDGAYPVSRDPKICQLPAVDAGPAATSTPRVGGCNASARAAPPPATGAPLAWGALGALALVAARRRARARRRFT